MSNQGSTGSSEPDVGRFEGEHQRGWTPSIEDEVDREDRTVGEGGRKAFDASNAGPPGPEPGVSEQEREGVPPTDTTAASPLGVGVSTTRRGEDVATEEDQPGHHDTGPRGASQRPSGTSSAARATGVDPQEPIDDDSPNLTPGS
jgi:hypothetical protein